jgi:hypothetical protein
MVAGLKEPNVIQAIIARIAADSDVAALVAGRVANVFPEGNRQWGMPKNAILVGRAGGMAPEMGTGSRRTRVMVRCYGAGATPAIRRRTADDLWQTMNPVLCPPPGSGHPAGWRTATMIVSSSDQAMDPIPDVEQGTDWPLVICFYWIKYTWRVGG